jgi:hypothetical protein
VQVTPHAPQLEIVDRSISQPVAGFPSQSANPEAQTSEHAPAVHTGVALGPVGQGTEHAPQLDASIPVLISQPSEAFRLQSL